MFLKGPVKNNDVVQVRDGNFVIYLWKLAGALVKPNGMRIHSYNPHGVMNAV